MLHDCKNGWMVSYQYCIDYVKGVQRNNCFLKLTFCSFTWILCPVIVPSKSFSSSILPGMVTLSFVPIYLLYLQIVFTIYTWNFSFHNEIFGRLHETQQFYVFNKSMNDCADVMYLVFLAQICPQWCIS